MHGMALTGSLPTQAATEAADLRLLIDSTPALIHTSLPDGYLDFFNQPWLKYVGRSVEDLQGWKWTECIHPDDIEGMVKKWRASLATGEPFLHEARVRRADGEYRWMLHRKIAARDEHGRIVKWYGSSIDIEERKRAEEQLRRSTQELQRSEFYLAEGQRLGHAGAGLSNPTSPVTIGRASYTRFSASTPGTELQPLSAISREYIPGIAKLWRRLSNAWSRLVKDVISRSALSVQTACSA